MDDKEILWGFPKQDLEQVVQEAKLAAIQHVKEKLTRNFESVLWEDVLKYLERSMAKNTLSGEETYPAPEETDMEAIQGHKKIYLYGIAGEEAETVIAQSSLKGMTDEEQVYTVSHKDLIAVVCEVPREEFNEARIQELAENRDWLGEKAERHQKVISAFAERYPVIPMRFCTLYPSQNQLKIFIEENYHTLKDLLNKIRHKTEWGVKLYLDEERFKNFLQEKDEGINKLIDEISLNLAGKGYLPKKKLANRIEKKVFDFAEEVHRRLCRFSASALWNKPLPREVTGKTEQMILNGVYLLETIREEEFFQTVQGLKETEGAKGFIFEISGPWPCYNFCQISSTGT